MEPCRSQTLALLIGLGAWALVGCDLPQESQAGDAGMDEPDAAALPDVDVPADAMVDAGVADAEDEDADVDAATKVAPAPASTPAVASSAAHSFVVWVDERGADLDIYGARVDANGTVLDPGGIAIATAVGQQNRPAVAWAGSYYLASWMDRRSGSNQIYAARISSQGVVLDPNGIEVSPSGDFAQLPSVAAIGELGLIAYEGPCGSNCTGVVLRSVDAEGQLGVPLVVATSGRQPSIAARDGEALVAYADYRSGSADVYAQRISATGLALAPELTVSTATAAQTSPSVAAGDSGYLVAWVDTRNSALDYYYRQVGPSALGVEARLESQARWQDPPRVAYAGAFLLAYSSSEAEEVASRLLTIAEDPSELTVLADEAFYRAASEDARNTSIACRDTTCIAAWQSPAAPMRSVVGGVVALSPATMLEAPVVFSTVLAE